MRYINPRFTYLLTYRYCKFGEHPGNPSGNLQKRIKQLLYVTGIGKTICNSFTKIKSIQDAASFSLNFMIKQNLAMSSRSSGHQFNFSRSFWCLWLLHKSHIES